MRLPALVIMSFAWASATAATVYKWVDENGVTHYSDQPHPGAKKLDVQSAQTYSAPPPPAAQPAVAQPATPAIITGYKTCELFRPLPEEVLFNVSSVTVKLRLDPQLQPGDQVVIALDGKQVPGLPTAGEEFVVTPVYRGTHSVMALVRNSEAKTVCQTAAVTFHVQQASVLAPRSPNRPANARPPGSPRRP